MTEFMPLLAIAFAILIIFLALLLAYSFLVNPERFLSNLLPEKSPDWQMFWSKDKEVGEGLIVYYGVRMLAICLLGLLILWLSNKAK